MFPLPEALSKSSGTVSVHFNNFSIFTDVFLAICYRQASHQQLEKFDKEIREKKGNDLGAEMHNILQTLARPDPPKSDKVLHSNSYNFFLVLFPLPFSISKFSLFCPNLFSSICSRGRNLKKRENQNLGTRRRRIGRTRFISATNLGIEPNLIMGLLPSPTTGRISFRFRPLESRPHQTQLTLLLLFLPLLFPTSHSSFQEQSITLGGSKFDKFRNKQTRRRICLIEISPKTQKHEKKREKKRKKLQGRRTKEHKTNNELRPPKLH
jgi:hypothetical protein